MAKNTYNPIRIKNQTVESGYIPSEARYAAIRSFCKKYKRPISVLDIGAAEGYFTIRLAEDFDGSFISVEKDKNRDLQEILTKNDNPKISLLETEFTLKDIKRIKKVEHFDIVLALNVIHHFKESFQEVLNSIMSMCSYCFFEHPEIGEDSSIKNSKRVDEEVLNLETMRPKNLLSTIRNDGVYRKLILLENDGQKTIDKCFSKGKSYAKEKAPRIYSNFDSSIIKYRHREESRTFWHGMNLRTFIENKGVYPSKKRIVEQIFALRSKKDYNDLAPHNIIMSGGEFKVIDQDDALIGELSSPKQLIDYLNKKNWKL